MAVAINTTKRKFHKLLENITNSNQPSALTSLQPSNHSTTTLSSPAQERPQKRIRSDDHPFLIPRTPASSRPSTATSPRPSLRTSTPRSTITARAVTKQTSTESLTLTPRKPVNYNPWDQGAFLARLKTFADVRFWTPKPAPVNEVAWAKRGWSCDTASGGINTVACKGGCEARVVVKLRPERKDNEGRVIEGSEDFGEDVSEGLVGRYAELVVEGHGEGCLWRRKGCGVDVQRVSLQRVGVWGRGVRERYSSVRGVERDLPVMVRAPEGEHGVEELVQALPEGFWDEEREGVAGEKAQGQEGAEKAKVEVSIPVFRVALFGWHGSDKDGLSILHCTECFARVGLWIYDTTKQVSGDAPPLDLLECHRDHCPWKNPESQASGGLAAWQVLQQSIWRNRPRHPAPAPVQPTQQEQLGDGEDIEREEEPIIRDRAEEKKRREKIREEDNARIAKLRGLKKMFNFGKKKKVEQSHDAAKKA